MARPQTARKVRRFYQFIEAHQKQYAVKTMCRITYIRTWQGWLYLAVVMDLFSRKIIGWSTKPTMTRELALDAVLMAVRRRRPRRTLIHSDQGSQYGSDDWRRFCRANDLEPSMSRRGNCWDTQSRMALNARSNLTRAGIG